MDECLNRQYTVGEKRLIEWQIKPNTQIDTVVVTDAYYELLKNGEVVKTGIVDIDGRKISCMFEAEETGSFLLRVFVTVPPETVKAELYIDVSS